MLPAPFNASVALLAMAVPPEDTVSKPRLSTVVLMAGLQGSGKTTASAKLALWWKQQGRNPILIGADLQRPAAVEQLRILGAQAGVTVFSEPTDPVAVARAGVEEARRLGKDVAIIDTAGRLTIDAALMSAGEGRLELRGDVGELSVHFGPPGRIRSMHPSYE